MTNNKLIIDFNYEFVPTLNEWKELCEEKGLTQKKRIMDLITNDIKSLEKLT
jgi:hypothetical protein